MVCKFLVVLFYRWVNGGWVCGVFGFVGVESGDFCGVGVVGLWGCRVGWLRVDG